MGVVLGGCLVWFRGVEWYRIFLLFRPAVDEPHISVFCFFPLSNIFHRW